MRCLITPEEIQATIVAQKELEKTRQDDRQPLYVPVPEYEEEAPKQEAPKRGVIVICF